MGAGEGQGGAKVCVRRVGGVVCINVQCKVCEEAQSKGAWGVKEMRQGMVCLWSLHLHSTHVSPKCSVRTTAATLAFVTCIVSMPLAPSPPVCIALSLTSHCAASHFLLHASTLDTAHSFGMMPLVTHCPIHTAKYPVFACSPSFGSSSATQQTHLSVQVGGPA